MTEDSDPEGVVVSIHPNERQRYAQISPFYMLQLSYKFRNIEEVYKNSCGLNYKILPNNSDNSSLNKKTATKTPNNKIRKKTSINISAFPMVFGLSLYSETF